jgi:hypothetical protein
VRTPVKLGIFSLGLVVVFAAAIGAGRVVGPVVEPAAQTGGERGEHQQPSRTAPSIPGGLQVVQDGYRLTPLTQQLSTGRSAEFAFRLLGPDGTAVTSYTPTHERDLHLIVVRRDLTGFQHVHPALGADGVWRISLSVSAGGQYRVFADYQPAGRDTPLTLGVDVPAAGVYGPTSLPAAQPTTEVHGYRVQLHGDLVAGTSSKLTFEVSRDGQPVTDLAPYLGAYGHLVALRDGDLAYLHVHPDSSPGDGRITAGPQVSFHAQVPSTGAYRLFLDFEHAGAVHTAEFTAHARGAGTAGAPAVGPPPSDAPTSTGPHSGHG